MYFVSGYLRGSILTSGSEVLSHSNLNGKSATLTKSL